MLSLFYGAVIVAGGLLMLIPGLTCVLIYAAGYPDAAFALVIGSLVWDWLIVLVLWGIFRGKADRRETGHGSEGRDRGRAPAPPPVS